MDAALNEDASAAFEVALRELEALVARAPGPRPGDIRMSDRLVTPARADDDVQYQGGAAPAPAG